MNLKNLKVIFIDWGGTLIFPGARVLGECVGVKIDQDRFRDIDDMVKLKMEEAKIPANLSSLKFYYQLLIDKAFPEFNPEEKKKTLLEVSRKPSLEVWSFVDKETKGLLEFLYPRFPLAVLANDTKALVEELKMRGFFRYFQKIFYSEILGAEKPSPKIFLAACKAMRTKPEKSLYIGDVPKSDIIEGANRVGMRGIIVNRYFSKKESNLYCVCKNLDEVIEYFKEYLNNAKVS
jgi:FMN phosphatase YigB (HAD superfamily)